jgi:uncharacterized protein
MLVGALSGIATGTLLGLLGGGGSIIAVPILVYILGLEPKAAIGTSLLIVGVASLLAAWSHYRDYSVRVSTALLFGATGALGAFAGARLAHTISDVVQLVMFAVAMAIVGLLMLRHGKATTRTVGEGKDAALPVVLAVGLGAGLLTGLLGVGGGFIIVPALTMFLHLPIKQAIGTSLLVIGINSLVAAISYGSSINLSFAILPFAIGTLAAAPVAGRMAHYIPQDRLKTAFAFCLLLLSVWMIAKQFCC